MCVYIAQHKLGILGLPSKPRILAPCETGVLHTKCMLHAVVTSKVSVSYVYKRDGGESSPIYLSNRSACKKGRSENHLRIWLNSWTYMYIHDPIIGNYYWSKSEQAPHWLWQRPCTRIMVSVSVSITLHNYVVPWFPRSVYALNCCVFRYIDVLTCVIYNSTQLNSKDDCSY